jgi:hypothetical protein
MALAGCIAGGGPVEGPADSHCGARVVAVDESACTLPSGGVAGASAVHFGTEADDDDCKYHLRFDVTPLYRNQDATFTLTLTRKTDGSAVTGASPNLEAFLTDTHPAPNAGTHSMEDPPGTYTLKPVVFDASGRWTVRFHLFETCIDSEDSPHGHVAFYVEVP